MAFLKFNKSELVNLEYSLKREIIAANKTGAYCNTSIVTCNTRRYHGLLAVPVDELGGGKYMLLSALDESLVLRGKQFNLGIHCYGDTYDPKGHKYIVDFDADPVPVVTYKVGGILFTKTIMMVPDTDQVLIRYDLLEAPSKLTLMLKPFLAFRSIHSLTSQNPEAYTGYDEVDGGVAFRLYNGFPYLNMQMTGQPSFKYQPYWYSGVTYSDEYRRGFDCREDLFVPGAFSLEMKPGDSVVFSASVNEVNTKGLKRKFTDTLKKMDPVETYKDLLVHNANLFKIHDGSTIGRAIGILVVMHGKVIHVAVLILEEHVAFFRAAEHNFSEIRFRKGLSVLAFRDAVALLRAALLMHRAPGTVIEAVSVPNLHNRGPAASCALPYVIANERRVFLYGLLHHEGKAPLRAVPKIFIPANLSVFQNISTHLIMPFPYFHILSFSLSFL